MKEMLRRGLKRVLRRLGHGLPYEAYLNRYVFSYHLAKLFRRLEVQCVIDVGAHQGGYGRFLRDEVGYVGLILSFEPAQANLVKLQAMARGDPKWRVFPIALGSADKQGTLNLMQASVLNSFLQPEPETVPDFAIHNRVVGTEVVAMRRLDSVVPEIEAEHALGPIYLKVDTQGFDFEVLQGATDVLDRSCGVQTEASVKPLYKGSVPYPRVLAFLEERGFEVTGMFPVARDELLRLVEFDLVMARRFDRELTVRHHPNPTKG